MPDTTTLTTAITQMMPANWQNTNLHAIAKTLAERLISNGWPADPADTIVASDPGDPADALHDAAMRIGRLRAAASRHPLDLSEEIVATWALVVEIHSVTGVRAIIETPGDLSPIHARGLLETGADTVR